MKYLEMISLITLTILVINVAAVKWNKRKEDCIVDLKHQIEEATSTGSLHTCLARCQLTTNCMSVSWYQDNDTCLLFNESVLRDNRQVYNQWIALENWKTYSKVEYPVVRRMHPDPDRTLMNFDVAVQTCIDLFSTIASPEDLLQSRTLGMDSCVCGWLSNGRIGMVTQEVDSCPDKGFSTEVIYCNSTSAIAWCKLY